MSPLPNSIGNAFGIESLVNGSKFDVASKSACKWRGRQLVSHIFKDLHALSLCHYDNLWTLETCKYCVEAFSDSFGGAGAQHEAVDLCYQARPKALSRWSSGTSWTPLELRLNSIMSTWVYGYPFLSSHATSAFWEFPSPSDAARKSRSSAGSQAQKSRWSSRLCCEEESSPASLLSLSRPAATASR